MEAKQMEAKRGKKLYEGKAKIVYETSDPDLLIQEFKDDATAFDATKRGSIQDKGIVNNRISSVLFQYLEDQGIHTHFVRPLGSRRHGAFARDGVLPCLRTESLCGLRPSRQPAIPVPWRFGWPTATQGAGCDPDRRRG